MTPPSRHDARALLEQAGWIRALARRLVGVDADDLVQETLLAALERPPKVERALRPWLAGVVKNLAANRQRARRHRGDREARMAAEADSAAPLPSPDELVARSEQQREVVDAVLGLDEPYRSTLLLRYFEGLEPVEIARRQGIPDATVRTRLARGVDRIRARLDDRSGGDRSRWMQALVPLAGLPGAPLVPLDVPASPTTAPLPAASAPSLPAALFTSLAAMPSLFKITLACIPLLSALFWFGRDPAPAPGPHLAAATPVAEVSSATAELAPIGSDAAGLVRSTPGTTTAESLAALAETRGTLVVLDRRTGKPVWGLRFREPRAEDDNPMITPEPVEEPDVFVTDRTGQVTVPRDLEGIVPLHGFASENAFSRVFRPGVGAALRDPTLIQWDDDSGVARVDLGPTILLDLTLPGDVKSSDVFALLSDRAFADSWSARPSTLRTFEDQTFVRFNPEYVEQTRDVWLHLVTADGRHGATVRMDGLLDEMRPIPVAVTERGVLSGSIQADDGGPLPQVEVFLFPGEVRAEDVTQPWMVSVPRLSMSLGREANRRDFEYAAVPPGTYTICAHGRGLAPYWETLEVAAGARTHSIGLERVDPATGVLEGRITSRSGRFDAELKAVATDPTPWAPSDDLLADVHWTTEENRRVGTFRIEGVIDRPHPITLLGVDEHGNPLRIRRLLPAGTLQARPGKLVEIELADEVTESTLLVRATDRATGEPVDTFHAYWRAKGGDYQTSGTGFDGKALIRGVRDIADGELVVTSRTHRVLTLDAEVVDGESAIDVELVSGWSANLQVSSSDKSPIPKGEVLLDGVRVGTTDESGGLEVDADAAPVRIEIRAAGWRMDSSNCLAENGTLLGRYQGSCHHLRFSMVSVD